MLLQVYVKRKENRDAATSLCQKKGEQGCCYKSMSKEWRTGMLLQVYVKRIENGDAATSLCHKNGEQ